MTAPILKFLVGLILVLLLGAFCATIFQAEVSHYGTVFINTFGLWGIAIGTLLCDSSPIPLTNEPFVLIALGANIPVWKIILIMSAASHCGAPLGYACGYLLGEQPWFQRIQALDQLVSQPLE